MKLEIKNRLSVRFKLLKRCLNGSYKKKYFVTCVQLVEKLFGNTFLSFLRKQESSLFSEFWTPAPRFRGDKFTPAEAGAGVTALLSFSTARVVLAPHPYS
jgi:hypothetical protein